MFDGSIQQLYNSTWNPVLDGIPAWSGCRFMERGLAFNDTEWTTCAPLFRAAKETNTKFQRMIAGDIPEQADPGPFVKDDLAMHQRLGIDGFSIDHEQDCAPRAATEKSKSG